jgi:hypothetical protein
MRLKKKDALTVRCPTCGARAGEMCELATGQARTEPHRERRLTAEGPAGVRLKLSPAERL